MKRVNAILVIILLVVMAGCGRNRQVDETDGYITVDVTSRYPKKELILQDFMDVEYIALETTDEFVTEGSVMDIGKEIIMVKNRSEEGGDIFIFDRTGKGLRKINRKGQGPEEYFLILPQGCFLDEDTGEMFIADGMYSSFMVYDLYGKFKRKIKYKESFYIATAYNYDKDNILCPDPFWPQYDAEVHRNSFYLISKQDGSMKEVEIPFKKKISTRLVRIQDDWIISGGPDNSLITPFQNNWILTEPSSDTLYRLLSDHSLLPFMVRTPSVQSMDPEVFLFPGVLTDRYYFMQTAKKEYDFTTHTGVPPTDLVYDRQEKAIYQYTVYNGDFSKKTVNMSMSAVNAETYYVVLEAYELVEACKKGELQGKLKEIAATLDEDSNPVIMLIKHKK